MPIVAAPSPAELGAAERGLVAELGRFAAVTGPFGAVTWGWGRRSGRSGLADFGRQNLAWAATDAAIAAAGLLNARRAAPDATAAGRRARRLRRVLQVNAVLDVGYIAGGAAAARTGRPGSGAAVALHGLFLLWLDARYARIMGRLSG